VTNETLGFMCATEYEFETGRASGGVLVYSSIGDLTRHRRCVADCGIVEVEVILRRVIQQPKS